MVQSGAKVTDAVASSSQILSSAELVLAAVQLAHSRVNIIVETSVTAQRLVAVRTQMRDELY